MLKEHLKEKRNELIWALVKQDYTYSDIAKMFHLDRSTALRIVETMPRDWQSKCIKKI